MEVTDAPEIPLPELSDTLPLTVFCAETFVEQKNESKIAIIPVLIKLFINVSLVINEECVNIIIK